MQNLLAKKTIDLGLEKNPFITAEIGYTDTERKRVNLIISTFLPTYTIYTNYIVDVLRSENHKIFGNKVSGNYGNKENDNYRKQYSEIWFELNDDLELNIEQTIDDNFSTHEDIIREIFEQNTSSKKRIESLVIKLEDVFECEDFSVFEKEKEFLVDYELENDFYSQIILENNLEKAKETFEKKFKYNKIINISVL